MDSIFFDECIAESNPDIIYYLVTDFSNNLILGCDNVGIFFFCARSNPKALGLSDTTNFTSILSAPVYGCPAFNIACKLEPDPDSKTIMPDIMPPYNLRSINR